MRANERMDERVAQYLRLDSCLFQTTVHGGGLHGGRRLIINRVPPSAMALGNSFPADRRTAGVNSPLTPHDVLSDTSNSHYSGEFYGGNGSTTTAIHSFTPSPNNNNRESRHFLTILECEQLPSQSSYLSLLSYISGFSNDPLRTMDLRTHLGSLTEGFGGLETLPIVYGNRPNPYNSMQPKSYMSLAVFTCVMCGPGMAIRLC